MATTWTGLLAPIGVPTGDGRRFALAGVTNRPLPLPLKWQRQDEQGHDASVIVGSLTTINVATTADAITNGWVTADAAAAAGLTPDVYGAWGSGEMFDDADPAMMPRLAEDVAEALTLLRKGVIGPSVDAGAATAVLVAAGSDTPLTDEDFERMFWESANGGPEVEVELLFTEYEIAAATLVSIPAFAECRPFVVTTAAPALTAADDTATADHAKASARMAWALAAGIAGPGPADPTWFDDPQLDRITPLTIDDSGHVFGHIATHDTCHAGNRDVCVTAPVDRDGYGEFNRYPVDVDADGTIVMVGRLTIGHGRHGARCGHLACRGNDDHACKSLSAVGSMAHHDDMTTVAWVRCGEDTRNNAIWVSGIVAPTATPEDIAALTGARVSGDWREVRGELRLVEVLVLSREQPGFPLPRLRMDGPRVMSLTAAGAVHPTDHDLLPPVIDPDAIADAVAERLARRFTAPVAGTLVIGPPPEAPLVVAVEGAGPDGTAAHYRWNGTTWEATSTTGSAMSTTTADTTAITLDTTPAGSAAAATGGMCSAECPNCAGEQQCPCQEPCPDCPCCNGASGEAAALPDTTPTGHRTDPREEFMRTDANLLLHLIDEAVADAYAESLTAVLGQGN